MSRDSYSAFILDTTHINTAVQDLKDIEAEVFLKLILNKICN